MFKEKDFYYRKARLTQVRGFCAVVQSNCSITEASEKIHFEPCTLSKQISALERDLGIKLIDRTHLKKLNLTKEGQLFYKEAVQYMNGIDGLFKNFNEHLKEFNNNHLNIALHQMAITCILPKILEKMLKIDEFKNLEINIFSLSKDEAIKKLINKEIDLVFDSQNIRDKIPTQIEAIKSIQSRAFLVFSKFHPLAKKDKITIEDIEKYHFLNRDTELKVLTNYNIKTSNIIITGKLPSESIMEIIKHTNNLAIITNMCLSESNYLYDENIIVRDIENLLIDKAFFQIMTLKKNTITRPMMWVINELKKIK
ncbi:MAG TPA: LysR family transcriptional regulator [Rickettsiales bacterium]|nr:LysR family transcriptional regulator [Rickettsiales bacterium]